MAENLKVVIQAVDKATTTLKTIEKNTTRLAVVSAASFIAIGREAINVAKKIAGFAIEGIKLADRMDDISLQTGVTTETLSVLGFAAERSGSSLNAVSTGLRTLAVRASDANNGLEESVREFKALGVEIKDDNNQLKSIDQLLFEVAEGLSKMENSTQRAASAQKLLGRGGLELLPVLTSGKEGLEQFRIEAERLGKIVGTDTAKAASILDDRMVDLQASVQGIQLALVSTLGPAIEAAAEGLTNAAVATREFITDNKEMIKTVIDAGTILAKNGAVIVGLIALKFAFIAAKTAAINLRVAMLRIPWLAVLAGAAAAANALLDWNIANTEAEFQAVKSGKTQQERIEIIEDEIRALNQSAAATEGAEKRKFQALAKTRQEALVFLRKQLKLQQEAELKAKRDTNKGLNVIGAVEQKAAEKLAKDRTKILEDQLAKANEAEATRGKKGLELLDAKHKLERKKLTEKFITDGVITIQGLEALLSLDKEFQAKRNAQEEQNKQELNLRLMQMELERTDDVAKQEQLRIDILRANLELRKLSVEEFNAALLGLDKKQFDDRKARAEKAAKVLVDIGEKTSELLLTNESDRGNALKSILQSEFKTRGKALIQQGVKELLISAGIQQANATIAAPLSLGASLFAIPLIAGALAAGTALLNAIPFAEGGVIAGGIPNKDSVLIRATPGEGVLKKDAVDMLNSGQMPNASSGGVNIFVEKMDVFGNKEWVQRLAVELSDLVRLDNGTLIASKTTG